MGFGLQMEELKAQLEESESSRRELEAQLTSVRCDPQQVVSALQFTSDLPPQKLKPSVVCPHV